jgi:hypothetical protein
MPARIACCLLLALTVAACGADEPAATSAGPDQPVSQPQRPDASAPAREPASERTCRRLGRRLIGIEIDAAAARAGRRGCTVRIAVEDGRHLALTEDYQPARINLRVQGGAVAGVEFMG